MATLRPAVAAQALEGLRAGDLVHQVAVDVQHGGAASSQSLSTWTTMRVPDLVTHRRCGVPCVEFLVTGQTSSFYARLRRAFADRKTCRPAETGRLPIKGMTVATRQPTG